MEITDIVDHVETALEAYDEPETRRLLDVLEKLRYAATARVAQMDCVNDREMGEFDDEPGEFSAALAHWQDQQRESVKVAHAVARRAV